MSADGSPTSESELTDAEQIRARVLACPDVADLTAGAFGEVASHFPGRSVPGVRVDENSVDVRIVARYGSPLHGIAKEIGSSIGELLRGRQLTVHVDDVVLPGESPTSSDQPVSD